MRVKKADYLKRIVYGEVYAPGVPDTDGELMTADTIEDMAHKFMKDMRLYAIDKNHDNELIEGACIVESFIARKGDPDFIEGSWVAGVHVPDDETWALIENQEINGFSMEAMVKKRPVVITMEMPENLVGKTDRVNHHTHEFNVSYDDDGNFLGGRTSVSMGHSHLIKRGTVTEESDGHTHRFSFVELINAEKDSNG